MEQVGLPAWRCTAKAVDAGWCSTHWRRQGAVEGCPEREGAFAAPGWQREEGCGAKSLHPVADEASAAGTGQKKWGRTKWGVVPGGRS